MSPRFYHPDYLYEVSRRTLQGEYLFDLNNPAQTDEITGLFAEGQRRYGVRIFAFHLMSNHYHGIFDAPTPQKFAKFLGFVHAGMARVANRDRKEPSAVWERKFRPLPVSTDETTLMQRMKYILGQAVRAGLVTHPSFFGGASTVDFLVSGVELKGKFVDHSAIYRASISQPTADATDLPDDIRTVEVAKLPCFKHLEWAELHPLFRALADEIAGQTEEQALRREDLTKGTFCQPPVKTVESLAAQGIPRERFKAKLPSRFDPETGRPRLQGRVKPKASQSATGQESAPKRQEALLILSSSQSTRAAYKEALGEFVDAYRKALRRLNRELQRVKQGLCVRVRAVRFPDHALLSGGLWSP